MEASLVLLSLVLGLLLLLLLRLATSKPHLFPPGPPAIPVLGSWPFLWGLKSDKFLGAQVAGSKQANVAIEQVQSYGPVTGLYTGNYPFIVLNDWKLAKSLFAKEEFSGRIK